MKKITFSDTKRPILTFDAENTEFAQDGDAILLTAHGNISFQDQGAWEDIYSHNQNCLLSVTENDEEIMSGWYHATFMALEPEFMVVRIAIS